MRELFKNLKCIEFWFQLRLDLPWLFQLWHRVHYRNSTWRRWLEEVDLKTCWWIFQSFNFCKYWATLFCPHLNWIIILFNLGFSLFRSGPKPWSELLTADMDTENWVNWFGISAEVSGMEQWWMKKSINLKRKTTEAIGGLFHASLKGDDSETATNRRRLEEDD